MQVRDAMLNSCDRDLSNSGDISSRIHQAAELELLTERYKLKYINIIRLY
ncbi:hypothetical protein [Phormidium nigroviride]